MTRRAHRVRTAVVAALAAALGVTACSSSAGNGTSPRTPDGAAGAPWSVDGPVVTSRGSSEVALTAIVSGEVGYDGGCLTLSGMPAVWPEGTGWDAAASAVVLPDGTTAAIGATVDGGGGYLGLEAVNRAGGQEVAAVVEPCLGSTGEMAFFNLGAAYASSNPPRKNEAIQQLSAFSKVVCKGALAVRYADQCSQAQELAKRIGGSLP